MPNPPATDALSPEMYDELDAILDDIRTRFDETPQWEFCEGFMAALICTRRPVDAAEYFPVLLDVEDLTADGVDDPARGCFADAQQAERFMQLWHARWDEVVMGLDAEIQNLAEDVAYHPEVMDIRGAVAALPEDERQSMLSAAGGEGLPAFGQVWALGFMYAVENWSDEWQAPRDKKAAKALDEALLAMVTLTGDDSEPPTIAVHEDQGPPSVSSQRMEAFAQAIWAVYDLRALWREIGPHVETVYRPELPGRNDPCFCGSGKKYKKCHGA